MFIGLFIYCRVALKHHGRKRNYYIRQTVRRNYMLTITTFNTTRSSDIKSGNDKFHLRERCNSYASMDDRMHNYDKGGVLDLLYQSLQLLLIRYMDFNKSSTFFSMATSTVL